MSLKISTSKIRCCLCRMTCFFLPQSTLADMAALYQGIYSGWSQDKYQELVKRFPISDKRKINTFSKG